MTRKPWVWLLALWLGLGLLANFIWEMVQMSLYGKADMGWRSCFVAALGDVALLGTLYLTAACAAHEWAWFARLGPWRWLALVANGALPGNGSRAAGADCWRLVLFARNAAPAATGRRFGPGVADDSTPPWAGGLELSSLARRA
jgi:hypothetical protein